MAVTPSGNCTLQARWRSVTVEDTNNRPRYSARSFPRVSRLCTTVLMLILFLMVDGTAGVTSSPQVLGSRPPIITEMSNDTVYFKGRQPVRLFCKAEGSPAPVYTWLKNKQPFNPSGMDDRWGQVYGEGTLMVNDPRDSDSAIYQCLATNQHGTAVSVKINLLQTKLDPFPEADPTYLRPQLGSPVTLPCAAPHSVPKAKVAWFLRNQTGHLSEICDFHLTHDYTGSLRITDLKAMDGSNGSAYVCMATNDVTGQNSVSAPTFITPSGQAPITAVSLLWTSATDTLALVGEQVRMKCIFAGRPTPRVDWTRNGAEITPTPLRSQIESFGKELVIYKVQKEDEGSYECEGYNDYNLRPRRKAFHLSVQSKPQWTHAPDDVTACVGGAAAFTCSGSGIPRPDISLSIDGTPVEELPASPRRSVNVTVNGDHASLILTYVNLTLSDAQVIQCNISNSHGYIFTNAYLNVIGESVSLSSFSAIYPSRMDISLITLTSMLLGSL